MRLRSTVIAALLLASGLARAGDPTLDWRTLETEHFRIHFYRGEDKAARALAVRAERAHRILSPILGHAPATPTHILLTDQVDSANGSASVLPYNLVELFASYPESESVLNDFDDWLQLLIMHEYSHILHIDNVSGVPTLLNAILGMGMGKVYAPNQIQPRWFIEGLATYEESARTTAGRTRSKIFDMWLRMAVLEDQFQGLDQVTSGTYYYPHGSTAYLYGCYFIKYIADRFGDPAIAKTAKIYGGTTIPFGLNKAIAEATGHAYDELWADFYRALRHRYEVQRDEIVARGRTVEKRLTFHEEGTSNPHPTVAGDDILYTRNDGYDRIAVMSVPARGGPTKLLYKMESGGPAVPLPDGKTLLTSENEVCRTYYYYNDLFLVDVESGRRTRLTTCARAMDPDVSPDGRWVAYTHNEDGGQGGSLGLVPTDGSAPPCMVVKSDGKSHVYTPAWSPDGKSIAYSIWEDGGYRDIAVVEVATGQVRRLTHDRALDIDPRYSPDGKYVLFSSDRTGVYNVFAYELATGRIWQVTNVLGGAFQPIVANDGHTVVYEGFDAKGYDIYAAAWEPATWKEALPYVSDRDDPPLRDIDASTETVVLRERPYSAWETAHPWRLAGLSTVPGGFEQLATLDLSGSDATGMHTWLLHLEQGLGGRGETNESLSYTWDRLWAPISASFAHATVRSGGLTIDQQPQPYAEEQYSAQLSANLPVVKTIDHSVTIGLNYHYLHFAAADPLMIPLDPNQAIPQIPEHGALTGLGASFTFSNVRRYGFSITGEEGRTIGLNLSLDSELFGGDFHTATASWSWTEFLAMPFRRNVLVLSYDGGIGTGNLQRRGLFFLGGFGQNAPLSDMILCAFSAPARQSWPIFANRCPGGTPNLRGYSPGAFYGDQFHVASAEYRFPIAELEKGNSTLPLYANRIVGAVYSDYGLAYFGDTKLSDFRVGVGGELGLNLTLGYAQGASLRVGYARGLMSDGQDQVYFQFQLGQLY